MSCFVSGWSKMVYLLTNTLNNTLTGTKLYNGRWSNKAKGATREPTEDASRDAILTWMTCKSVPQMPEKATRTITSSGATTFGRATFSRARLLVARSKRRAACDGGAMAIESGPPAAARPFNSSLANLIARLRDPLDLAVLSRIYAHQSPSNLSNISKVGVEINTTHIIAQMVGNFKHRSVLKIFSFSKTVIKQ